MEEETQEISEIVVAGEPIGEPETLVEAVSVDLPVDLPVEESWILWEGYLIGLELHSLAPPHMELVTIQLSTLS